MGYCTYNVRPSDGLTVAAWIGTGTDQGRQVTVTYKKGSTNQAAACNDVRNQFCKKYGCSTTPARTYKAPTCPARCATYQHIAKTSTSCKCVNNAGVGTGGASTSPKATTPSSRTYKAPTPTSSSSSSSSTGKEDPYCKTDCDAVIWYANLGCRLAKLSKGCGGAWGGPPLEGNIFNFSGSALDPKVHNEICAKNCDALDVLCKGAKVQAGCGGTDYTFWIILGVGGIVGVYILTRILKR
jgi:hypothetical protein